MLVLDRRCSCDKVTESDEFVGRIKSRGALFPQYLMTAMFTAVCAVHVSALCGTDCLYIDSRAVQVASCFAISLRVSNLAAT